MPIRAGIGVVGTGELDATCDGDCTGFSSEASDYDHKVSYGFGIDFLGAIGNLVRLGGGLFYVAPYEIDIDQGDESFELGSDLSMNFVFEMTPEVGPNVWLVPRAQLGLTLLFPSGDFADGLENAAQSCEVSGVSSCNNVEGVKAG